MQYDGIAEMLLQQSQMLARDFEFPGNVDALASGRDAVMDFVREHCSGEQQEIDIFLALQEALANAILHGSKNDATSRVRCTVEITPSAIKLVVRDPGEGFSTESTTDIADDGTNLTEHGRGICLMRTLMDEVTYHHRGREVEMKKLRLPAQP